MTYLIILAIWLTLIAAFITLLAHRRDDIALTRTDAGGPPRNQSESVDTAARVAVPPQEQPGSRTFSVTDLLEELDDGPCATCDGWGALSSPNPMADEIPCPDCQPTAEDHALDEADRRYSLMKEDG